MEIFMPEGALGASENDDIIDKFLRELSLKIEGNDKNWCTKYGTDFENDVFMIHRFCWCDREDCPWCSGCRCPDSAFHYFLDGKEVSYSEYQKVFDDTGYEEMVSKEWGSPERKKLEKIFDEKIAVRNKRCEQTKDDVCDYCSNSGVYEKYGKGGNGAPNFWHKPTGFKVWWYKYIGRSTEYINEPDNLKEIMRECFRSLKATR